MLDFIRKLLGKQKTIVENIREDDLDKWIRNKTAGAQLSAKENIASIRSDLSSKILIARESIDKLEDAQLRNPNISVKEKQFMQGNRKAYIQKTRIFLRDIEDSVESEDFFSRYKADVESLSKSTYRSFMILQEFFRDDVIDIAAKIKEIDNEVNKLKKADDKLRVVLMIKQDKQNISNSIHKKQQLNGDIHKDKEELVSIKKDDESLISKKKQIIESDDYKSLGSLHSQKQKLADDIKSLKTRFFSDFSVLDRPLRKYEHIALYHADLIAKYNQDAFAALIHDEGLAIIEIMRNLQESLKQHKLSLKDKQNEKALEAINTLDRSFFEDIQKEYHDLKKELDDTGNKIKDNNIETELEMLDEKIRKNKLRHNTLQDELASMQKELDSIDITELKKKLLDDIEEVFKVRLEIG